jgi:hypothetical protein
MGSPRSAIGASALASALAGALALAPAAQADTVILYGNDFETPNVPLAVDCGNSLDARGINFQYGTKDFVFDQTWTVETVFIQDPSGLYSNPQGQGGAYALGMLSAVNDDHLSLTFDAGTYPYVNVGLDISAIDISGCGGPFGVDLPIFSVSVLDSPGGVFGWSNPLLDQADMNGLAPPDPWTFNWSTQILGLDISGSTDGNISVVFDLLQSGYAAFDNMTITASTEAGIVDRDLDGVPDDDDNCPDTANAGQEDGDDDGLGDACDECPENPDPSAAPPCDGSGDDDSAPDDDDTADDDTADDDDTDDDDTADDDDTDDDDTDDDASTADDDESPVDDGDDGDSNAAGCGCNSGACEGGSAGAGPATPSLAGASNFLILLGIPLALRRRTSSR